MRFLLPLVAVLVAALSLVSGEKVATKLDPEQQYQAERAEPVDYEVDFAVTVTPPSKTKVLKVWLPLPQSDLGQEVSEGDLTSFPIKEKPIVGTEPVFGNKFAYFEFQNPQGAQIIRHRFKIKTWELSWKVDSTKVDKVDAWPRSFEKYLRGDDTVVVNDLIRKTVEEVVPSSKGAASDLAQIMDWIHGNITYDHKIASLEASSLHALKEKRGHCSDYHGLCAAMGRALNYPTRVTYGINPFPKSSPSHCKLEVYLPPYGWVSFDVSETQKLIQAIDKDATLTAARKKQLIDDARERLRRGYRDNTWFLQTRGTDYELVPPAARKVRVVRTIYAEADGVALPEPDPANPAKREFSWMTAHEYKANREVPYPFSYPPAAK